MSACGERSEDVDKFGRMSVISLPFEEILLLLTLVRTTETMDSGEPCNRWQVGRKGVNRRLINFKMQNTEKE